MNREISPRIKELTERLYKPTKKVKTADKSLKSAIEDVDKEFTYKPYMYTINSPKTKNIDKNDENSAPRTFQRSSSAVLSPRIKEITERLFQPAFQPTTKWGKEHKQKVLAEKDNKEKKDIAELTFQPRLHTKREPSAYSESRRTSFPAMVSPKIKELSERLYSAPRSDSPSAKRSHRLSARLAQEQASQKAILTFAPDLGDSKRTKGIEHDVKSPPSPKRLKSRDTADTCTTSTTITGRNIMSSDSFSSPSQDRGIDVSGGEEQGMESYTLEGHLVAEAAEIILQQEEETEARLPEQSLSESSPSPDGTSNGFSLEDEGTH